MKSLALAALASFFLAVPALATSTTFRAPAKSFQSVTLAAPKAAEIAPASPTGGRLKVGDVRPLAKAVSLARWEPSQPTIWAMPSWCGR